MISKQLRVNLICLNFIYPRNRRIDVYIKWLKTNTIFFALTALVTTQIPLPNSWSFWHHKQQWDHCRLELVSMTHVTQNTWIWLILDSGSSDVYYQIQNRIFKIQFNSNRNSCVALGWVDTEPFVTSSTICCTNMSAHQMEIYLWKVLLAVWRTRCTECTFILPLASWQACSSHH